MIKEKFNEIKNEVRDYIKDKAFVSWSNNVGLDDIFVKHGLYEDKDLFINTTTELCMDLQEEFFAYHIEDDILFSTQEIEYYIQLEKVINYLGNKLFTREELRKAIDSVGATFRGKSLSDMSLEKIYEMLYNEDNGLLRQTVYVVFGGDK